jgi:TonB family protein
MRMPCCRLIAVSAMICLAATVQSSAQVANGSSGQVWVVNLSAPAYPPLPRQARIMGDVVIQLEIRADGSVASAEVVSGPPMLRQGALDSARKSTFHCESCGEKTTPYTLTYTFGFREDSDCGFEKRRSIKCLYLWRCGPAYDSNPGRPPVVGRSTDRAMVLADVRCVETEHTAASK